MDPPMTEPTKKAKKKSIKRKKQENDLEDEVGPVNY